MRKSHTSGSVRGEGSNPFVYSTFVTDEVETVKADDYVRMLQNKVPEQSLSIATNPKVLKKVEKQYVADKNQGYRVFDADGKVVYEPKAAEPAVKVPFLVKVSISDLNIRKGPGVNHSRVQFCPPGIYTIVAVSEGAGASMWGKLKSGIGWLSLDFCRRL